MQNAMNENKNDWSDKSKHLVDRAMSEVKNINPEDIKRTATELTAKVRDASVGAYDDAVGYVRRNPVKSALGLCAFGFVTGVLSGMFRKSA